jgi:hypothetical protein
LGATGRVSIFHETALDPPAWMGAWMGSIGEQFLRLRTARRAKLFGMSQSASNSPNVRPADESERDPRLEREGLEQWFALGQDDTSALCDPDAGVPLRWVEGVGWVTE